jgi:hypothetical protein
MKNYPAIVLLALVAAPLSVAAEPATNSLPVSAVSPPSAGGQNWNWHVQNPDLVQACLGGLPIHRRPGVQP